ncbi:hypothetical protein SEA_MAGRITTE_124 [Microbacterium phage Magritte]|nr:hypothetical protein SEA_MAGRITTE_124 [Microbacterium phage Magritte]
MTLSDLREGDSVSVLNGRQNSVFDAEVVAIIGEDIHVFVVEKDVRQVYDRTTGRATGILKTGVAFSTLVPHDDWRAVVLRARQQFKQMHQRVIVATKRFRDNPTLDNDDRLRRAVAAWSTFVATAPDDNAIRADSIEEYQRLCVDSGNDRCSAEAGRRTTPMTTNPPKEI